MNQNTIHKSEVDSGEVSFAIREDLNPTWHSFANATFDHDAQVTTAEMLKSAELSDWNVRLEPATYPQAYRPVSEAFNVLRTNPRDGGVDVLATVGKKYRAYQNEQLFAFGDNLLDGGGRWDSAGSVKDGRVAFGSLILERELILDPQGASDATRHYLLVTTSHDGSSSIKALVTPVRVLCQNSLNVAIRGAKQSFAVRHTTGTDGRLQEARTVLGITHAYLDEFDIMAQDLFQSEITNSEFDKIVAQVYPSPDITAKAALTRYTEKVDLIRGLYLNSPTQTNIVGTKWGALNALTEHLDYFRNGDATNLAAAASGFEAGILNQKARILEIVQAA